MFLKLFLQMTIMLIALLKNKGFILFEELLKTHFQDSSYKMKLIICKNLFIFVGFVFFAFFGIKRIINDLINGN